MLIQQEALKHWIDHYYGYGSWKAPVWFVAWEEGGGDTPEEVSERLAYFSEAHADTTGPTLCDMRDFYRQLSFYKDSPKSADFDNMFAYRFGSNAVAHGVWKNLIAFTHGYNGAQLPTDLLAHQRAAFATGGEALIRLYPLPSPHNHAWYYSWLDMPQFPFLKSRSAYESHLFKKRMEDIMSNILSYKPNVVLMYGMSNINAIKHVVRGSFPDTIFSMVKATPRVIPQHHVAQLGETRLVITTQIPTLRHNRVETGFDWEAFGHLVASHDRR